MELKNKKIVITGGAGFIGTNTVLDLAVDNKVIVVDNLSRKGTENNLKFLQKNRKIDFHKINICNKKKITDFFTKNKNVDVVIHLAGQVAVTTSIEDPYNDFKVNIEGTVNILNALVENKMKPIVVFSSTNKVYGNLESIKLKELKNKYKFTNNKFKGVTETQNLDFYSPYGCSKGSADQYVRDFYRIYNIPTIVFRQSCIYGDHQFGVEDQGWLAWLMAALMDNKKIKLFGTGKQVRDVLYVKDLVRAYKLSIKHINKTKGQVFNIGGGIENSISLLEFLELISKKYNLPLKYIKKDWRQGDQYIYISDYSKFQKITKWTPKVNYENGIDYLYNWLKNNFELTKKILNK